HPRDVSEGQRLALVLAVTLTAAPPVLLLDEPTRGLDYPAKAALAGTLHRLAAAGRAVLLATHDVEFVAGFASRVVVLAGGEVVAMLGVLSALGAAIRPVGAGTAGIETVFFLLVLAGRVFGPGFGFVLGNTMLFASALLTAGVGPWLPYQMLGAAWVALFAGLLPRCHGRVELALLAGYGVLSALAYGLVL